jgi:hypothetical protein
MLSSGMCSEVILTTVISSLSASVVNMLAFGTQVCSSNPAEAVGFFGRKNPQHAFLRRGSKAVCPMS